MRPNAKITSLGRHAVMLFVSALFVLPLVWMVGASLKSGAEYAATPTSLWPDEPRPENYADAVAATSLTRCLINSIVLCVGSVVGTLVSCTTAAYAFSRLRWPGRDLAFGLVVATMLLPWQATMVPRFLLIRELGLYDSLAALVVPKFFGEAFSIFLLRQFFRSLPGELLEAARLDGCNEWGVFCRVVLPLTWPALATVALLQFAEAWNDYGGPLLYLSDPAKFPLTYGLERFVSARSTSTQLLLAAATLFTVPVIVAFLFAQRSFVRGVVATGVKQ